MEIPSSLLFQNERIYSIYTIPWIWILCAVGVFLLFFMGLRYFSRRASKNLQNLYTVEVPIPSIEDEEFEKHAWYIFRSHIIIGQGSHQDYVHSLSELSPEISGVGAYFFYLRLVEASIFSGDRLPQEKRREIRDYLISKKKTV